MQVRGALSVLLLCAVAPGGPVEEAAEDALAAHRAGDEARLRQLAASQDPVAPWIVADELWARGEMDAALAFARAAPPPDEKLAAFIESLRGKTPNAAARAALRRVRATGDPAALEGIDAGHDAMATINISISWGFVHAAAYRHRACAEAFRDAGATAERIGWRYGAQGCYAQGLRAAIAGHVMDLALDIGQRCLAVAEALELPHHVAEAHVNLGTVLKEIESYDGAVEHYEQALRLYREIGFRPGEALTLVHLASAHAQSGHWSAGLELVQQGRRIFEELGDQPGVVDSLNDFGIMLEHTGDLDRALEVHRAGLQLCEKIGDRARGARAYSNIAHVNEKRGYYAAAAVQYDLAAKHYARVNYPAGVAHALRDLGKLRDRLGDSAGALELYERALDGARRIGERQLERVLLTDLGFFHLSNGDTGKALDFYGQALKLADERGDRAGVGAARHGLGLVHQRLGKPAEARAQLEQALAIAREDADPANVAIHTGELGVALESLGELDEALAHFAAAAEQADELGLRATAGSNLARAAALLLERGRAEEALATARRGVGRVGTLHEGVDEWRAAASRERWGRLYATGLRAAVRLDRPDDAAFFLEAGRAAALLDGLERGRAVGTPHVAPIVLEEEREARAAVERARRKLRAGDGKAREELAAAERNLEAKTEQVRLHARAALDVTHPKPAAPEEVRAALRPGEVFVAYALLDDGPVALLTTSAGSRIVALAPEAEIAAACGALRRIDQATGGKSAVDSPRSEAAEAEQAVARLRRLVFEPLGLGETAKRVLVAPDGALGYVPFVMLAGGRDVAYAPSATVHVYLRTQPPERGEGVLALGDPDYSAPRDEASTALYRRRRPLPRLEGSGEEARAVGDVVLERDGATEAALAKALAARERWRAVHLACHGLIRPSAALLSTLALAPDPENDGYLTLAEVFRMRVPADLVALSACETAKGESFAAEGIFGFVRAFLVAGSSRVLVSLWRVSDEATAALMKEFYAEWGKGTPADRALRLAQDHVRLQKKWAHPYYWAAWQLWGLPD